MKTALLAVLLVCGCSSKDMSVSKESGHRAAGQSSLAAGSIFMVPANMFASDRHGYALLEFGEQINDKLVFRFSAETYETRDAAAAAARGAKAGLFSDYSIAFDAEQVAKLQTMGGELLSGVYGPHR